MSRTKKRSFLILLLLFILVLIPAGRVYAAVDEEVKDEIEQQVTTFLSNVYTVPDDELETLRETSSFYEILVRSWYEDRKVTGDFVKLVSTEIEDPSKGQIIANSVVEFENYTSDVVIYFDEEEIRPVNYVMNIRYSMAEKMTQAAQNMAVGLIVVFVVLIFLMFIIFLFRFIAPKQKEGRKEEIPETPVPAKAPAAEAPAAAASAAAVPDNTEEEIAAVIAAAIAAASEEAPSPAGYVVRSVRRGSRSVWKRV